MVTRKHTSVSWVGVVPVLMLFLVVFSVDSARAEGLWLDSTGKMIANEKAGLRWQGAAAGVLVSNPVSILIYNPELDTPERLTELGYQVTESYENNDLVRDNLQNYDVLWLDVGHRVGWAATYSDNIQAWVEEDGGGVVVTQPNTVGQHQLLPTGFEVYVDSIYWPGWPGSGGGSTFSGLAHPITDGITEDSDLPGNGDWVWAEDIGASWDILAVDRTMPDEVVSVLAGGDGLGRWVYNNGNFSSSAGRPASNRFVNQMVCWAAQVEPPPPCQDLDEDGYGDPANPNCKYVLEADCDDTDPEVHPDREEICDNGIDDDCDGAVDKLDSECGPEPWSAASTAGAAGLGGSSNAGPETFNFLTPFIFSLGAILLLKVLRRRRERSI